VRASVKNASSIVTLGAAYIEAGRHTVDQARNRLKLALMVNMIAPARIPVYSGLARNFDLLVLHGGTERNRDSWRDLDKTLSNARVRRIWGWQIRKAKKVGGRIFDYQFIHLSPGLLWHLLWSRPDAVVTIEMGLRTVLALSYGTLFRKPVWVWWGGTRHSERTIGLARRILRHLVSRWARHWISYGETSTEYLLTLGIPRHRILQIQNAVDERRFCSDPEPEFRIHPRPVLLHVGQFIPRKGIDLLLKAAAVLQNDGEQFSLLLVGSGPDKLTMERLVKDLHLKEVHFYPSQAPEKMPSVYRSADVLIFPTLEDVWGLVANEAVLCGLSVLCSKYAGCAEELFAPNSTFDPNNLEEFVAKLRKAVAGRLPKPEPSRLKTTAEIVDLLVRAIEDSVHSQTGRLVPAQSETSK
jgi:glycosyltransferase involved in cell wall biosynthesis